MRTFILLTALATAITGSAYAAPCRDAHGRFMKCAPVPAHCRDAHGRFAKCGMPGAHPG